MSKISGILASVAAAALAFGFVAAPAHAGDIVGLITKTNTNPFFVKMKQGFEAKAKELGLTPQAYAGKFDGDNDGQVAAIEQLMAAGAKGILLVPSDSTAIVPTVEKARKAGIVVITLDTPLDPADAADANIGTDNFKAGELIGEWAKATLGDKAKTAKIATLDLAANQPSVDYLRHNGFLTGFGIPVKNPKHYAQSDSPQIVGSDVTQGSTEGGRKAMENILQKADHIDVVYAINEPPRTAAYAALKAAGKEKGVIDRRDRRRLPGRQVGQGRHHRRDLAAIPAADGRRRGRGNRRVHQERHEAAQHRHAARSSITDHPVPGVPSITVDEGMKLCWG